MQRSRVVPVVPVSRPAALVRKQGTERDGVSDIGESAPARFRRSYPGALVAGLLVSALLHAAVLELAPALAVGSMQMGGSSLTAVSLPPPSVEIPPSPERIARPATPRVSEAAVAEDITIAPTTFEANPPAHVGPPPPVAAGDPAARPAFIPHDTPPRVLDPDAVSAALVRFYPPVLREAGVGGVVVLWIYVDERGGVIRAQVHESSGHSALDAAAEKVASIMRFRPALNRDKPVAVWVTQGFVFQVK